MSVRIEDSKKHMSYIAKNLNDCLTKKHEKLFREAKRMKATIYYNGVSAKYLGY